MKPMNKKRESKKLKAEVMTAEQAEAVLALLRENGRMMSEAGMALCAKGLELAESGLRLLESCADLFNHHKNPNL